MSTCALCGAELVDHAPAPAAPADHSVASVEIAAFGPDQRSRLGLVLESSGVPFELAGDQLRFPESRRPDVEMALAGLRVGADPDLADLEGEPAAPGFDGNSGQLELDERSVLELGTTARRVVAEFIGAVLWGAALTAGGVVADRLGVSVNAGSLVGFVLITLVNASLVARFGADPGKFVLRLRIVDRHDRWPTWSQALLRAVVLFGPYWGLGLLAGVVWEWDRSLGQVLAWAPLAWVGLVVWSIATNPQRQGWHDRAAGTWVIRHRPN